MAIEDGQGHALPSWFLAPGEADTFAWLSLGILFLMLYGVVTLYAAFDRWAEHKSTGTPLATTIPTLLTIALLFEIFPLAHFHVLLPLTAILIALMADWSRYNSRRSDKPDPAADVVADAPAPAEGAPGPGSPAEETRHV